MIPFSMWILSTITFLSVKDGYNHEVIDFFDNKSCKNINSR